MIKLILTLVAFSISPLLATGQHATEISSKQRQFIASKQLKTSQQTLALYVKGLICESCGIGVKKKAARLKFIDKSKLTKGYKVDAKNQLLYLSIAVGKKADYAAINKAVKAAGYVPVTYYISRAGRIKSFAAEQK